MTDKTEGSPKIDGIVNQAEETQFGNQATHQQMMDETRIRDTPHSPSFPLPDEFGRYEIKKKLGQGAMGAVYLALDTTLDREVALKIPKFGPDDGREDVERFYREARAMATLHHPNLCAVYDVGEHQGTHYLCMAYIKGRSLEDYLKGEKAHPGRQVAAVIRKIALALEEAHHAGVVHRDLKPANVMIDKKGEPVIMDFGLARRQRENETTLTQAGQILGTPAYMSPEQVEGHHDRIGPATDVYALGVICYEMLCGQRPFQGTLSSVMVQIMTKEPQRPSERTENEIDPALESICLKAMSKGLDDRYASAQELANALKNYLKGKPQKEPQQPAEETAVTETVPDAAAASATGTEIEALADDFFADAVQNEQSQTTPVNVESAPGLHNRAPSMSAQVAARAKSTMAKQIVVAVRNNRRNRIITLVSVGGLLLALGVIVLLLPGKNGTIRIEINDPEIEVTVAESGYKIKGATEEEIELEPGEHLLTIKRGDFKFETDKFVLKKDETIVVKVEFVKDEIKVFRGETIVAKKTIPAGKPAVSPKDKPPVPVAPTGPSPPAAKAPFDEDQAKAHQDAWAKHLGIEVDTTNSIGMKMRLIPPGEFTMGESDGAVLVELTRPFRLGIHEVTQAQWKAVMGTEPWKGKGNVQEGENVAAAHVNWEDATEFCNRLSEREGLGPYYGREGQAADATVTILGGRGYRLPTEAEWEFACRAGSTTTYSFGHDETQLGEYAWYIENAHKVGEKYAHAVGLKKPNALGLYDMHGNVLEWCADWHGPKLPGGVNPHGPSSGLSRVMRGGHFSDYADYVRLAYRANCGPDGRGAGIGFRVARTYP